MHLIHAAFAALVLAAYANDVVRTPFGLVHRDCVLSVPSGTHISETSSGDIVLTFENATKAALPACSKVPRAVVPARRHVSTGSAGRAHSSGPREGGAYGPPTWEGWPQHYWFGSSWADWTQPAFPPNSTVYSLNATWVVPPRPAVTEGNASDPWGGYPPTLSWWTGLQGPAVLQPVLEWNGLIPGQYDAVSWNCCPGGYVWHSRPLLVEPGDVVFGSIVETVPPSASASASPIGAAPQGGTYATITSVTRPGAAPRTATLLTDTSGENGWAGTWPEVVQEGYFVTQCSQLPCYSSTAPSSLSSQVSAQGGGQLFANLSLYIRDATNGSVYDASASLPWSVLYEEEGVSGSPGPPLCAGRVASANATTGASSASVTIYELCGQQ